MSEQNEPEVMDEETSKKLNQQTAEITAILFKEMASIPADEIYKLTFEGENKKTGVKYESVPLLEAVQRARSGMMEAGKTLPRGFFDNHQKVAEHLINTFRVNIQSSIDASIEIVLREAVGKSSNDMSYTDIHNTMKVETPVEETTPE